MLEGTPVVPEIETWWVSGPPLAPAAAPVLITAILSELSSTW